MVLNWKPAVRNRDKDRACNAAHFLDEEALRGFASDVFKHRIACR